MHNGEAQDERAVIEATLRNYHASDVRGMPAAMFPGLVGETGGERRFTRAEVLAVLKAQKAVIEAGTAMSFETRRGGRIATEDLIRIFERME